MAKGSGPPSSVSAQVGQEGRAATQMDLETRNKATGDYSQTLRSNGICCDRFQNVLGPLHPFLLSDVSVLEH